MKKIAIVAVLLALSGCANLKFAWSASYQTDNLAADLKHGYEQKTQPAEPVSYRIGK